ncbi:exonuclease [Oesophagostomum dentatum]|uniref:RNA exonuclease 4 n=1 Tax=Oesophagostomum dentatum TaxID=61180 RepID=A0A0B1SWJ0_OESDE|nr:exonuclease [Oesophagostomum dentatum]
MVNAKGTPIKVDPKDVSPAWKVLQMKMKEQEAETKSSEKVEESSMMEVDGVSKKHRSRKRKRKEAFGSAETHDEPKPKKAEDIPVVVHDDTPGEPTPVIALDCEYVGGGTDGSDDILARVSIVNQEGKIVYDKYVKPRERVTDFRTSVSGIRPSQIANGLPFDVVQKEVAAILKDRTVVGHALNNDFRVLSFHHNSKLTRDTAKCALLRKMANCHGMPSLKKLANSVLGIDIQQGEHDSVVDARVALRLYLAVKKKWESDIKRYRH